MVSELIFKEDCYQVMGSCFEVYKKMGCGCAEPVSGLWDEHRAQVHNYLKSTGYRFGPLVRFGHCLQVDWERIVR